MDGDFADLPSLRGDPVPADEIDAASTELGHPFPQDYREFLMRYGSAIVGPYRLYGLRKAELMGAVWSVIEVNKNLREEGYPRIEGWLVISEDHSGNPYGITQDGTVWVSDHDFGQVAFVADSFEGFVRRQCLKLGS